MTTEQRPESVTMEWTDYRGKAQRREVRMTLDARDFLGTPVFPWLIIAANRHLSAPDIELFLELQSEKTPGCARSLSWIKRRRWMTQLPGTDNSRNRDGNDGRALRIMAARPTHSIRDLVKTLEKHGIKRGRDWVMRHRVRPPE